MADPLATPAGWLDANRRPGRAVPGRLGEPPVPRGGGWVAGGDGGDGGDGLVDVGGGVVEVEAEPAAGGRVEAEVVVGQGGAVAAGPGLDPGLVELSGYGHGVVAGQVERDQ